MRIMQQVTNLANKVVGQVKESQHPKDVPRYDEKRIEREVAYAKRIHRVNPKMKALEDRRMQIQKRRSR